MCNFSRWIAADLYYKEIDSLLFELSMFKYTPEVAELAAAASERRRLYRPKYRNINITYNEINPRVDISLHYTKNSEREFQKRKHTG